MKDIFPLSLSPLLLSKSIKADFSPLVKLVKRPTLFGGKKHQKARSI